MNKGKILRDLLKAGLQEHVIMRENTTLKIGGVADYFFEAKTVDELIKAVKAAKKAVMPYFILGWGSNILFSDFGFPGLVIKNSTQNTSFLIEKSQVIADSGVTIAKLILEATSNNLSGLEFLFSVPGTIGGAIYGNAGAYSQSIGDFVKSATVLMPGEKDKEPEIVQLDHDWFEFGYRTSRLKELQGLQKPIILTVTFQLAQNRQEEIMRRLNNYKNKRSETQPVGQTCGCIFKNPIPEDLEGVEGKGSVGMPEVPAERTAGYLLDSSGAKKLKSQYIKVSPKHANFLLTAPGAKAQDARKIIEEMRTGVMKKYNINLKEEIEYIGQW
jgi:UDP-N-acetylmuramate dehydrogenase